MSEQNNKIDKEEAHIVFLCDASGSMSGDRIANLNNSISSALNKAVSVATTFEPSILDNIDVSAIRFSDTADWHLVPSKLHEQFIWDDLQKPSGISNLGAAYDLLDRWLTGGALNGAMHTLIIILITDGMPTDDPKLPSSWLKSNKLAKRFERIAFAIGNDAESSYLDDFISDEDNLYVLKNESMLNELLPRALGKAITKIENGK